MLTVEDAKNLALTIGGTETDYNEAELTKFRLTVQSATASEQQQDAVQIQKISNSLLNATQAEFNKTSRAEYGQGKHSYGSGHNAGGVLQLDMAGSDVHKIESYEHRMLTSGAQMSSQDLTSHQRITNGNKKPYGFPELNTTSEVFDMSHT